MLSMHLGVDPLLGWCRACKPKQYRYGGMVRVTEASIIRIFWFFLDNGMSEQSEQS